MTNPVVSHQPLHCVHYLDAVRKERGGVVQAVLNLTAGLAELGARVTLLTGDATDVPSTWRAAQSRDAPPTPKLVTIPRLVSPWARLSPADREPIEAALADADALHLHTPWDPFNPLIAAAARRRGTPYFVSAHGMLDDWAMGFRPLKKRVYLRLIGGRFLRNAHAVVLNSETERDESVRYTPGATRAVLPLLLDLPVDENTDPAMARDAFPALTAPGRKLLLLSRVFPGKGVERLIDATATLVEHGEQVTAFVAGPAEPDYLATLQLRAAQRGIADRIHILGPVYGQQKSSLFSVCDCFVLPSDHENFGLASIEAMLAGLPVVTTNGVHIWRELQRCGATIVDKVAVSGEFQLTDAIRETLARPRDTARQMRASLLDWIAPQKVAQQYLHLYGGATAAVEPEVR